MPLKEVHLPFENMLKLEGTGRELIFKNKINLLLDFTNSICVNNDIFNIAKFKTTTNDNNSKNN